MSENILLGQDRQISEIPRAMWEQHLAQASQHGKTRLSFMTEEHHQVRCFMVKELVDRGKPIEAEVISQALQLPVVRVRAVLDELERKLFFLVRNEQGAVSWAYPVTTDPTPHRLAFSTGTRLYSA
jgi:hypothetical protein